MIEVMKTYKFKLYSAKRNKKLHRQINVAVGRTLKVPPGSI